MMSRASEGDLEQTLIWKQWYTWALPTLPYKLSDDHRQKEGRGKNDDVAEYKPWKAFWKFWINSI